jgi:hypothetical protein
MTADDVEFERWLLGQSAANERVRVLVWGADTRLPASFVVSAEAALLRLRWFLSGEDLSRHGPWQDTL